ncbi:hypothetical protein Scep_030748 [Stephania cephalantha]|uniref:Uncharacterized protein n=1 Tax=Stephania cephalantha TaxID=152367 RepID=A0AAP0E3N4_9MAGN
MVLANEDARGENTLNQAHVLPTVQLNAKFGHVAFDYLAKSPNPKATIVSRGTQVGVKPAPVLGWFSSRGPNLASPNILKPDLIAPGVDILAAWPDNVGPTMKPFDKRKIEFNIVSGTSMSCPHVSGVAALLKGAHRDWSTARIRSAMMTTSYVRDNVGNPILDRATNSKASAWGYGSGHVDPEKAIDPGLVFDLTVDDYVQFLCGSGYSKKAIQAITRRAVKCSKNGIKPWDLNYPSISVLFDDDETTKFEVAVTRTATLVSKTASTYTVKIESPKGFLVSVNTSKLIFNRAEEKQSYVVNISAANNKLPPVHAERLVSTVSALARHKLIFLGSRVSATKARKIQNDMKPNEFSTIDQWYRSTLAALESSPPDDADQDQPPMLHVYTKVFHGFSARLTKAQAEEMKTRPEVFNVFPDQIHELHTTRSPQFLGILNPQDHSKNKNHIGLLQASDYGSDVIIGVLDTGIWPESESFTISGLGPPCPLGGRPL